MAKTRVSQWFNTFANNFTFHSLYEYPVLYSNSNLMIYSCVFYKYIRLKDAIV